MSHDGSSASATTIQDRHRLAGQIGLTREFGSMARGGHCASELVSLGRIAGVRLISLQKQHGLEQLQDLPSDVRVETLGPDFDDGPDAFLDTAAVMRHLDLVVTVDTSIAHLAGALAMKTWIALKQVPDWRWLLGRCDNPWYPTLRLYRQDRDGDWKSVTAKMEQDLAALTVKR